MFAVIEVSGHQYKVEKGQTFSVEKLDANAGDKVTINEVLLVNKDGKEAVTVGAPFVDGASVELKVLEQHRGDKVRVFRMKAKKRERRTYGHRSHLSKVEVVNIKA